MWGRGYLKFRAELCSQFITMLVNRKYPRPIKIATIDHVMVCVGLSAVVKPILPEIHIQQLESCFRQAWPRAKNILWLLKVVSGATARRVMIRWIRGNTRIHHKGPSFRSM